MIQARDGNFYGKTTLGGTVKSCDNGSSGCGTIFRLTPAGVEAVLYDFGFGGNGVWLYPRELVEAPDGSLYGITWIGGGAGGGTAYRLTF